MFISKERGSNKKAPSKLKATRVARKNRVAKQTPPKVVNTTVLRDLVKIDEVVNREANGCYTLPRSINAPNYKAKQLYEYAVAQGKKTSELTERELAMFLIK